jgi:hypothetical protein
MEFEVATMLIIALMTFHFLISVMDICFLFSEVLLICKFYAADDALIQRQYVVCGVGVQIQNSYVLYIGQAANGKIFSQELVCFGLFMQHGFSNLLTGGHNFHNLVSSTLDMLFGNMYLLHECRVCSRNTITTCMAEPFT